MCSGKKALLERWSRLNETQQAAVFALLDCMGTL